MTQNIKNLNPQELAYIGDAYYELFIREYNINKNIRKVINLQNETVKYVRASYQAKAIKYLLEKNILKEDELSIFYCARNFKTANKARNVDILTYKHATGFEAVIGYLYLKCEINRVKYIIELVLEEVEC